MHPPAIAPALTEADWNNKKGIIAKIKGGLKEGTGLSAELKALKTACDAVNWPRIAPEAQYLSDDVVEHHAKEIEAEIPKVHTAGAVARKVHLTALNAQRELQGSVLTKKAAIYTHDVADKASALEITLNQCAVQAQTEANHVRAMKAQVGQHQAHALDQQNRAVQAEVVKVTAGVKAVSGRPTADAYNYLLKKEVANLADVLLTHRTLGASLGPNIKSLANHQQLGADATPDQVKAALMHIVQEVAKVSAQAR